MDTIFLDFESLYSDEYSLKKMTPVEYVLDPRFECHGCAVKHGIDGKNYWLEGPALPDFFASLVPERTHLVSHNYLFDGCIVAWRYGFVPRLMTCTLNVARATLGHVLRSLSLANVARHLDLGVKGNALLKVKGMSLEQIKAQPALYQEYVQYALDDNDLCAGIYDKLVRSGVFPLRELATMDMVMRCTVEPRFLLDTHVLAQHMGEVKAKKEHLLAQAMLIGADDKSTLMSNDRFAELLQRVGVTPPTKVSAATGKTAWAFAKTDHEFLDLQEHPDPAVQALVAARLGHKSTLEETRCQRLTNISQVTWPGNQQLLMPAPLRFSGAHTHRLSGDWSLNMQNLPRGGNLRRALKAAAGYTVFTIDASQIEARLNAWINGQWDLVEAFDRGEDVYATFAESVFGHAVNKDDNPKERFVGKTGILSLGYGLGHVNYRLRLKTDSTNQLGVTIELTIEESNGIVTTYRTKYFHIAGGWKILNNTGIPNLAGAGGFQFGPCTFEHQAIRLPSGLRLFYHDLHQADGEWWFTFGNKRKKIYGAKLLENICQALGQVLIKEAALRIFQRTGYRFALQVHDELLYLVRNEHLGTVHQVAMEEMTRRPDWGPDLPLAAEAGSGPSYGDAK